MWNLVKSFLKAWEGNVNWDVIIPVFLYYEGKFDGLVRQKRLLLNP